MTSNAIVVDVSEDWAMGYAMQGCFMRGPKGPTQGVDYSAQCRQLRGLGGDCYGFTPLPQDCVALTIGDASGKRLAAALMKSGVQASLRTAALFSERDLAAVLGAVNRQVYASSSGDRYTTLFYAAFDTLSRNLRYVNAGHNPPMITRRERSTVWLQAGGAPVGMLPDWTYEEATIQLAEGDVLVGYTDGIIEAQNPSREEWGIENLRSAVVENRERGAHEIVRAIFASTDEFSLRRQTDDATAFA